MITGGFHLITGGFHLITGGFHLITGGFRILDSKRCAGSPACFGPDSSSENEVGVRAGRRIRNFSFHGQSCQSVASPILIVISFPPTEAI